MQKQSGRLWFVSRKRYILAHCRRRQCNWLCISSEERKMDMRKIYENPEVEIVSFEAMEQIALLAPRSGDDTDLGDGPIVSGSVGDRGDY